MINGECLHIFVLLVCYTLVCELCFFSALLCSAMPRFLHIIIVIYFHFHFDFDLFVAYANILARAARFIDLWESKRPESARLVLCICGVRCVLARFWCWLAVKFECDKCFDGHAAGPHNQWTSKYRAINNIAVFMQPQKQKNQHQHSPNNTN